MSDGRRTSSGKSLKRGHYVRALHHERNGRVEWVGRNGVGARGVPIALVRWDDGAVTVWDQSLLEIRIVPLDAEKRIVRERT